jgi:hypothetical protein
MAESKQRQQDRERLAQLRADTSEVWKSPRVVKTSEPGAKLVGAEDIAAATTDRSTEPQDEDPWEKGKAEYKVDVLDLLKWTIASDTEHEHSRGDRATVYLMLDNYYEKVMVTGIPGLQLEVQTGEEQAMYYWFYRKSYGYGYSACPMGQLELAHKLKWSRDRVKRHLASLIKKGHITPLERYKMFQNYRPQVFEVAFPRVLLQTKIDQIKDEANREYIRQQIAKFLGEEEASA